MARVITKGNCYENLANSVVLTAVDDYRRILKRLSKNPDCKMTAAAAKELEQFFRSGGYSALTSVDGEFLIMRIRAEVMSK